MSIPRLEVITLPASQIRAGQNYSRSELGSGAVTAGDAAPGADLTDEELRADIEAHGLMQPIGVRWLEEGWTVVWGTRRHRACSEIDPDYPIPCVVRASTDDEEGDELEAIRDNVRENLHRRPLRPFEIADACYQLYMRGRDRGLSMAAVAREVGLSERYVAEMIHVRHGACAELWQLFQARGWSYGLGLGISDLGRVVKLPRDRQLEAWHEIVEERSSRRARRRKATIRRVSGRQIQRWLASVDDLRLESDEYRAGVRAGLELALGAELWPPSSSR